MVISNGLAQGFPTIEVINGCVGDDLLGPIWYSKGPDSNYPSISFDASLSYSSIVEGDGQL